MMMKRGSMAMSMFPNSSALVGWCRGQRRLRKRRGTTIRLGNKGKRRGFSMGSRSVVQWGLMVAPLRMLKKIMMEMTPKGKLIEAYYIYLPFLRPQLFPLC
ncbi:ubiquinone biosynthesis monooxygenase COQ6-like [Hibiscus syriacus]|uniref:Ubiquinone biosynthesis monooxygenase COQ6-like n=1 Tax=Hibiscus syriacus TaxID=106335 RepID=A0A6A2XVS8_HIBSY|nr:ubiquinone biosynthesis monooxygenase COQ6-like [Hibiscus syriacus]